MSEYKGFNDEFKKKKIPESSILEVNQNNKTSVPNYDACLSVVELSGNEVYVSAVGVHADPRSLNIVSWQDSFFAKPCLTVATLVFSVAVDSSSADALIAKQPAADCLSFDSDVQVLNQLNIALSGADNRQETQIIQDEKLLPSAYHQAFTCLVVYSIPADKTAARFDVSSEVKQKSTAPALAPSLVVAGMNSGGGSSNIGVTAEVYNVKDLDISDDDYDVQIIGMSSPQVAGVYDVPTVGQGAGKSELSKESYAESNDSATDCNSKVIQCIKLPVSGHYVTCVLPAADGHKVFVATASVLHDKRLCEAWQRHYDIIPNTVGGCLFVFHVHVDGDQTVLDATPSLTRTVEALDDAIKSAALLPADFGQSDDFEVVTAEDISQSLVAVTTFRGNVCIYSLVDLSAVAVVSGDVFSDAIYCNGVDRLCAVTTKNQLKFFSVSRPDCVQHREVDDELDGRLPYIGLNDSLASQVAGSEASSPAALDARHQSGMSVS
jgi:hypothetical protein